ncbi:MAG TPA: S-layer homology domain-containing protein [Bacillota bacterium]|nr:S-layer homology domain-containing protein [Bacillota bacterium]
MNLKRFSLPLTGVFTLLLTISPAAWASTELSDIQNHWAEKPINSLSAKAAISGYPDGTFKPDQPVTRAEFATMVAKTFGYRATAKTSTTDTIKHWAADYIAATTEQKVMNNYSDGTFRPESRLTRSQLVTLLSRVLHLGTAQEQYSDDWPTSFTDVPADHSNYRYVEIANKLELLPTNYQNRFQPDVAATRADAAWTLQALSGISVSKGKISSVDPDSGLVNIQGSNNQPMLSLITPETVILRNNATAPVDSLLSGDEVTSIAMPSGDVKFVKAYGKVTKNDLLSRISSYTKGNLSTSQINSIITGDWDALKSDLQSGLYDKMVSMGLTPAEAETILVQDWSYLDTLSRDRLAEAISGYLGITQEFSQAIVARDLQKVKEYGRIELATAALGRLLGSQTVADNN